jgi:molybdopterin molybdotransferase
MVTWEDALEMILERVPEPGSEAVPLARSGGRILAERVEADRDSPPFDRSAMDGYAVRAGDTGSPGDGLDIVEVIAAGTLPTRTIGPGQAARIYTGAAIPAGADAVQIQERAETIDGARRVRILAPIESGANIRRRGEEVRAGEPVLEPGAAIGPAEIGTLAWTGHDPVRVHLQPQVSIVASGDELVEVGCEPVGGQIRNSNTPMLAALTAGAGGIPHQFGIAGDDREQLRQALEKGLRGDLLLVSGGVSVGDRDLVRPVLEEIGVEVVFHRVAIQPGKPVLFGQRDNGFVFGLPGNPVSGYAIFHCLVRPLLRKMQGAAPPGPILLTARLRSGVRGNPKRLVFRQARLQTGPEGLEVEAVRTTGSSDLHACTRANAMILVPLGVAEIDAGEVVSVLPVPGFPE